MCFLTSCGNKWIFFTMKTRVFYPATSCGNNIFLTQHLPMETGVVAFYPATSHGHRACCFLPSNFPWKQGLLLFTQQLPNGNKLFFHLATSHGNFFFFFNPATSRGNFLFFLFYLLGNFLWKQVNFLPSCFLHFLCLNCLFTA